ncbi:MarR family transcriptional regulator [Marinobacter sp. BW6]|uniref:MarR family winged helix-turn-helix transcriptional regulator n=1 Tax=Marinobacter sp. BW6 TaxID=2592624 RepID=UPI0011DEE878|nr:MarR family transcriptional regulator [Marinobacter sp. BW6]TYC57680.1 MarR family transcriptional regulator [Marinobacter sp. BW6]
MSEHKFSDQSIPGADLLTLDRQMCFALYSASLAMTKLYKPLLSELGLTYPQYLVMLVLWEKDDIRVSTLKERLFLDYGTLTPLIKRLEKHGLLVRQRSPEDERQVFVRLTEKGRSLQQAAAGIPQRVASASGCSLAELEGLKTELCALRNRLHSHLDSHLAESA